MVRKISFTLFALAILVTGVIAFRNLNYWESSIWIFKLNSGQRTESRTGHGNGQVNGRGPGMTNRNLPDSLKPELPLDFTERSDSFPSDAGFRSHDGRGRGDFRGGKKINLGNVLWYLAVFSSFTVAAIYTDKWLLLLRKNKKSDQCK